jgi:hypothetical protein
MARLSNVFPHEMHAKMLGYDVVYATLAIEDDFWRVLEIDVDDDTGVAATPAVVGASEVVAASRRWRGRPPQPKTERLAGIKLAIADQPPTVTDGCTCREEGGAAVNVKRSIGLMMKAHGLFVKRHTGDGEEQRHEAASRSTGPTFAGARTGLRSAATTASGCGLLPDRRVELEPAA